MLDKDGLYDPRQWEEEAPRHRAAEQPCAKTGYRIRTEATWDQARAAYLEGASAEEVCARFDLSLGAFRHRARMDGWRKRDQADPPPVRPEDELCEDADYATMADHALRQMRRAMSRGRPSAATSWMRLLDRLEERARLAAAQARYDALQAERLAREAPPPPPPPQVFQPPVKATPARAPDIEAVAETLAARMADLERRADATDPMDSAGHAAIILEIDRIQAEALDAVDRALASPDSDDSDDSDCFFDGDP